MKQETSTAWIAQFLAADPPRSKSLVMTIFGDTIAPHGGAIWLGSLIDLLAPFGVNDRLLRTSVFRLVQEGWLVANRDGRRSAYAIVPAALPRFERANRRIYAPLERHWDGNWTLLFCNPSAIDAPLRADLRKELLWEGFAMIAPGMFGHPVANAGLIDEIVRRVGVQGKLFVCQASALPEAGGRPLSALVADGWDLSAVIASYRHFIEQFEPLLGLLEPGLAQSGMPQSSAPTDLPLSGAEAFVIRTLLIHAYRRVQLHDPMLPVELLPDPWPGSAAYALARTLYRALQRPAEEYIMTTLRREERDVRPADSAFYQRFGGLA